MNGLELRLLGRFQLAIDGQATDQFEADSARALFAHLAVHAGERIRREHLAGLLWPEQAQASALRNLRTALSRVRHSLGPLSNFLQSDNQSITFLLPPGSFVDAQEFEGLVQSMETHRHRRRIGCSLCIDRLKRAVSLYRGEFLTGFSFDSPLFTEWMVFQREHFHQQMVDALDALAEHHLLMQEWRAARRTAQQALQIEPWREESRRHLMAALAGDGQRSAALTQFHICERMVRKEFGADPQPETLALHAQILRNRYPDDPMTPARTDARRLFATGAHWLDDLPFVGREQELALLIEHLEQPTTRLVTLAGEGGVGKTRLALRAARILAHSFTDGVYHVPLHPEDHTAQWMNDSPASVSSAVTRQIAAACSISLHEGQPVEQQLLAYFRPRALLLLLDSFEHYTGAIPFLLTLLKAAPHCALLVTSLHPLNVRQEWVMRLNGLETPAPDVTDARLVDSVRLFDELARRRGIAGALSDAQLPAVLEICRAVNGLPLGIELAVASLPHVGGLERTASSMQTLAQWLHQTIDPADAMLSDLPPRHRGFRRVFDAAWRLLTDEEQCALATLSIFHTPFSAPAAAAVLNAPLSARVHNLLERLTERSLLHYTAGDAFQMHDLVCRFAREKLEALPNPLQAVTARHALFFLALLADSYRPLYGAQTVAVQERLNRHFEDLQAGWWWAVERQQWKMIAAAARTLGLFHQLHGMLVEGDLYFARTIKALRRQDASSTAASHPAGAQENERESALVRLLLVRADLLAYYAPLEGVEALFNEALAVARQNHQPLLEAEVVLALGWQIYQSGRAREAESFLDHALALAEQNDDVRLRCRALSFVAALYFQRAEWEQAKATTKAALALARQQDDLIMAATLLQNLSVIDSALYHPEAAERHLREALAIFQTQRMVHKEANALYLLGGFFDERGQYSEAQEIYRRALELAEATGNKRAAMETLINIGISLDQMGDYAGALASSQRARLAEQEMRNPYARATIFANLSLHAHHTGDQEQALLYAAETIRLATELAMPVMAAYGFEFRGHALLALADAPAAAAAYQEALQMRENGQQEAPAAEARAGLARAALAVGNHVEALVWIEPIVESLQQGTLTDAEEPLRVYWTACQVLRAAQDPRAAQVLQQAAALLQARAAQISDLPSRHRYLTAVEAHRQIWQASRQRRITV
ncbi:MAG: tetratricopeptide repeat protein [Caldilineaceae bacterium]|nr:tetratricopeptide repeat protein [Caldilineaceae bacterium]